MQMLLFKNIFSLNTREPTKLFSQNLGSGFVSNISSVENDISRAKKCCFLKCENVGHNGLSSSLKAVTDAAAITMKEEREVLAPKGGDGIGIVEFFEGKNLLITGATGFLAKALIEKMLRATPKIKKIYLLIRAKDKEAAFDRLTSEIMESNLFKCLKEMHGKSFKLFMLSKLVPVVGNIHEANLGMDLVTAHKIAEEIDLIVDSAAITTFDERYDFALDANVNGPYQLMMFARNCKKLKLFMHFSTAYANGGREGLILEKPFTMGESITKESVTSTTKFPSLHAANELEIVSKLKNDINNDGVELMMKDVGLERAKLHGWQDTYSFTKAIGEMVINSMREEIPILILRPSIIESSYKEPFPGWIQGFRVMDPLIYFYGKGHLPGVVADPDCIIDIVPVDMIVNATMAAIAKHGYLQSPEINVYHLASMSVNPLTCSELFDYSYEFFHSFPFINSKGDKVEIRKMRYFQKMSDFSNYIWEEIFWQHGLVQDSNEEELSKIRMRYKRKVDYLKQLSKLYEPYMFYNGWFHNGNMQKLLNDMSEEEKTSFEIDAAKINWRDYFLRIHIPGVQKHVLKRS